MLTSIKKGVATGVVMAMAIVITSCASYTSTYNAKGAKKLDGVAYFMPKRDFFVTLKVAQSKDKKSTVRTIDIVEGVNYADQSEEYILQYRRNLLGKNELDLSVTEQGLLQSSKAITTSAATQAFKNLASSLGQLGFLAGGAGPTPALCSDFKTYAFRIEPTGQSVTDACPGFCDLKCSLETTAGKTEDRTNGRRDKVGGRFKGHHGIFYRQAIPYVLQVTDAIDTQKTGVPAAEPVAKVVASPTKASERFVPISRTLFANNSATITLDDGILTGVKQDADGELVALFKLPADVIEAYFTAIGSAFTSRNTALTNEKTYLETIRLLEEQRKKTDACLEALADDDEDEIEEHCKK